MRRYEDIRNAEADFYKLDKNVPDNLETATLAMGCFWGVESLFGGVEGVYRSRVGYTGGDKEHPTYRSLGNHTETVQIDFDPDEISFEELLEIFFNNHNHEHKSKAQYASRIFYHDENQRDTAEEMKPDGSATTIYALDTFWLAEDYHQKYRIRGTREDEEILSHYTKEQFINSTVAAKLNAAKARNLTHEINDEEFKELGKRFL